MFATATSDYVTISTTLTYPVNDLRACVDIALVDDSIGENAESFTVSIQSASIPLSRSQATIVIQQDSGGTRISIIIVM